METTTPRFERSDLSRRTFAYACGIAELRRALEQDPGVPRRAIWQLFDSGTSVAANYAESRAASSRRDLVARERIVLREARESSFWLRLLAEPEARVPLEGLLREADELVRIFTASVKRLSSS
jgi:four helix bundle protein